MKLLQTKNAETARIQSWLDIKENEVTHIRSRAIMLETCGCPVENPECRFLQDAVEAKKKLPAAETELETYRQQAEERTERLDAEYQTAKKRQRASTAARICRLSVSSLQTCGKPRNGSQS